VSEEDAPRLPLPMFPLGTVLVPSMALPLHVFESRYRALTRDCLRSTREFGIVLIERGSEVGGGDSRFGIGTVAQIVESAELPDGRFALLVAGTRRIRIHTWLPDDPYPVALVQTLVEARPGHIEGLDEVERVVRRALALASELSSGPSHPATFPLDKDPVTALWQLCAAAPVGPVDRQELLETDEPGQRANRLAQLAAAAAEVLAYRLEGG
jgi:ATP-dependent Lon protease